MNPSAVFIRRPVATTLLTLGIALVGIAAYFVLPVASLPNFDNPTIMVQASLPGASPEVMATSVATPLERRLGNIADVTEMTSQSGTGSTRIVMQFGLDRDVNGAARDVQAAINASRADLPATLTNNPTYRKANPAEQPILIMDLTSDILSQSQVYDAAATIIQQSLSQVDGVGEVDVSGGASPAVRVEMNPYALNKYGIGLEDVRAAIASTNANAPKGSIAVGSRRLQVYTNDQATKASDYENVIIAYRNGAPVRIRDVAEVVDGPENINNLGLFNGKPAIVIQIRKSPGANVIATVDRIMAKLPQLRAQLPHNVDLDVGVNRTTTIRASILEVERTLMIAVVLVVLVVLVFLRNGRAILIPGVAVVVSLLGTLAVMFLFGFSLDNLSLMALTVATGFVVDDAIVVLENITRHVENGMPRFRAALVGAGEVAFTVLSMSISLIAVFIPILMMGGIVGRLFREFAVTLSASIVISLALSITATPMMAARLIDQRKEDAGAPRRLSLLGRTSRFLEWGFDRIHRTYEGSLTWALDNAPVVLAMLLCTVGLTIYLYVIVPKGFFPQQDTGLLMGGIQADQASSFKSVSAKMRRLAAIVKRDPAVATVTAFAQAPGGFMFVSLKPRAERPGVTSDMVIQRIRPRTMRIQGVQMFLQSAQDLRAGGRQSNAQYQYTLQSDDIDALHTWSDRLMNALKRMPDLTDVNTDQQQHGLETYLNIDRTTAARLGITAAQVDNTLNDAFSQRIASIIYNPLNQYHVIMEVAQPYQQNPDALKLIYVTPPSATNAAAISTRPTTASGQATTSATGVAASGTVGSATGMAGGGAGAASATASTTAGNTLSGGAASSGAGVQRTTTGGGAAGQAQTGVAVSTTAERMSPLSAFASYGLQTTPLQVNHQGQSVAATLSFNLAPGKSLSDAERDIEQATEQIGMPNTVVGSFRGTAQVFEQSLANEPVLILAALVAVYIVLGILYESYVHPLTVLSTLPSAGVGAVLALLIFHVEFSIIALIGVILLIGIVKKNAIMIIDFALVAEREQRLSSRDAIFQACMLRFRPILMTTCAAILGALPLAIGLGEGGEIRRPLGISIIGGLIASQLLTLLTTPVVYLYLDRLRLRASRRRYPRGLGGGFAPNPAPAE